MQTRLFTIDSYLQAGEHFHFVRKELDTRPPACRHRHDFFELFLIERGRVQQWINGRTETLNRGHLVFVRPDDVHAFRAEPAGCCILNVMFRREIADHLIDRYYEDFSGCFFWRSSVLPDAYDLTGPRMERAVNVMLDLQTSLRSLARIEGFLLTIMQRVVEQASTPSNHIPRWLVRACLDARDPHVFRKGAAGFVEAARRGHEHVCRQTRLHLGTTPSELINKIRMEYAAMILSASDTPVADIALDCGFENVGHFYTVFRQHYGATPGNYRRHHDKDPMNPIA